VVFSLSLLALPLMLGSRIQLMAICLLLGAEKAEQGVNHNQLLSAEGFPRPYQRQGIKRPRRGWSAGSVAGPVVSGMLIGITGYDGLIATLVASGVLFLLRTGR
jgi:hypothetical protein